MRSEEELGQIVLDYQKVFQCYEDLRRKSNDTFKMYGDRIEADTNDIMMINSKYTDEKIGDINFSKVKIEDKFLRVYESINAQVKRVMEGMGNFGKEYEQICEGIDGVSNEMKDLKEYYGSFTNLGEEVTKMSDDGCWDDKLDEYEEDLDKKTDYLLRCWECIRTIMTTGASKTRQKSRNSDLEIQKIKNAMDEKIRETERYYSERYISEKESLIKLQAKYDQFRFTHDNHTTKNSKAKEEEREFFLAEIEDLKISLENCYKTIDQIKGTLFYYKQKRHT